jgi:MFS family permease
LAIHHSGLEFHIPGEAYFKSTFGNLIRGFRGFGKDANKFVTLSLIGAISGGIYGLIMSLYLRSMGYDYPSIGLLMAFGTLTVVIMLIPSGIMAEIYGKKAMIVTSGIVGTISVGIFVAMPSGTSAGHFMAYAVANMLGGFANALSAPAMNAWLSEKSSERRRKYLFSLNAFAGTLGMGFGMLISGVLPAATGFTGTQETLHLIRLMFLISFFLSAAKTIGFLFIGEKAHPGKAKVRVVPRSWKLIRQFAITSALIGFGAGLVVPWFQVYFQDRFGASLSNIGYVFAMQQFIMAAMILLMPKLADRTGTVKAIVITQGIAILVLVLIPNSPLFWLAAIAFLIRAIMMNIASPIQNAFMMCIIEEDERSYATAIQAFSWNLFWSLGTIAAGYVMVWSRDAPFFITAGFYTVYIITFYLFFKDIKETRTDDNEESPDNNNKCSDKKKK